MKLIINADDFGLSKSITDGIMEGILNGYKLVQRLWLIWIMLSMLLKKLYIRIFIV